MDDFPLYVLFFGVCCMYRFLFSLPVVLDQLGTVAADSQPTMWLLDGENNKILPYRGPNFRCMRLITSRDETIAAYFITNPKYAFAWNFEHQN
jgi:hypothetical protein